MSEVEKTKKYAQAKELYLRELSNAFICEAVGITLRTLQTWAEQGKWNDLKEANTITPSSIRAMILGTVQAMKRGEQLPYTPDQLAKLASALEKLSDPQKHLGYFMEAYTALGTELMQRAQLAPSPEQRKDGIAFAKAVIHVTDDIISRLLKP